VSVESEPEAPFVALERAAAEHEPLRIRPSDGQPAEAECTFVHTNLFGEIPISGKPEMEDVGSALHAIFAVDDVAQERAVRIGTAKAILDRWNVIGIEPEDVIAAADRFWKHIGEQYPTATVHREVPVHAYDGLQVISGRIDILIDGPANEDWFVIYDHKSFPGQQDKWDGQARKHAPQLGTYADAVEIALGGRKRCAGCFVHMPVRGAIIGIQMQDADSEQAATIA
jgi:hypothetical protein